MARAAAIRVLGAGIADGDDEAAYARGRFGPVGDVAHAENYNDARRLEG